MVAVFIPEYVVGRWWEQLLHNQTALRLKGRLLFTPGVMVTSVPYQLRSSQIGEEREAREELRARAGDVRRGTTALRRRATATTTTSTRTRMARTPRPQQARGESRVGDRFEVDGRPGRARRPLRRPARRRRATRVVFVRHALPGERVVVEITEGAEGDRFLRGDAVEVLDASADRVAAPCPYAGPGRCGGCDFQHVALPAQRALKAAVVREQLRRLAGLDVRRRGRGGARATTTGLRWRTRMRVRRGRRDGRPRAAPAPLPRRGAGRPTA